jgi:hypothetical protein
MSDHMTGMARAIRAAPHDPDDVCLSAAEAVADHGHQARAAWAYALAALREPGSAVLDAARPIIPYPASAWALMVDAFACEHGLDGPAVGQEGAFHAFGADGRTVLRAEGTTPAGGPVRSPDDDSAPHAKRTRG